MEITEEGTVYSETLMNAVLGIREHEKYSKDLNLKIR